MLTATARAAGRVKSPAANASPSPTSARPEAVAAVFGLGTPIFSRATANPGPLRSTATRQLGPIALAPSRGACLSLPTHHLLMAAPLPVPGNFYGAFMGRPSGHSLSSLLAAWLGIIAVVVAGSTNLYWISRRWGPAMLRNPVVGRVVHLDEHRLERAHGWFDRW